MKITNTKNFALKLKGVATSYGTQKDFSFEVGENTILDVDVITLEKNKYFQSWIKSKFLQKEKITPTPAVKKQTKDSTDVDIRK